MLDVRAIQPHEIEQSLPLLVNDATLMTGSVEHAVKTFRDLARQERYDLTRQIVVAEDGRLCYACLLIPTPGHAGFIYSAQVDNWNEDLFAAAVRAVEMLRDEAFRVDTYLLQVLLGKKDQSRYGLFLRAGFRHLTDLSYLMCPADHFYLEHDMRNEGIEWLDFNADREELYKETICRTYIDSLDCPELQPLRDIDDVIASHKSAGIFEPRLWKLLVYEQQPTGVLLMVPMKGFGPMELVYMGLTPEGRGRGLGVVLLQKAFTAARYYGSESIILAVDMRNDIAFHLYTGMGFKDIMQRRVVYCSRLWC